MNAYGMVSAAWRCAVFRFARRVWQGKFGWFWLPAVLLFTLPILNVVGQGPITFGENHIGSISVSGEEDTWTFEGEAGDGVFIFVSEWVEEGESYTEFRPNFILYDPDNEIVEFTNGAIAGRIRATLETTGIFRVVVSDLPDVETGDYRLRLVKAPGPFLIPEGDDGGLLANGTNQTGTLEIGDIDIWTFEVEAGDFFDLSISRSDVADTSFSPTIWLYAPDGEYLFSYNTASFPATATAQVAEQTGLYTAFVSDFIGDEDGGYLLRRAHVPVPFELPEGDEGGPMVNGENHRGEIVAGDLDLWTFQAEAGDRLFVSLAEFIEGEEELSDFRPDLRLFDPDGVKVGDTDGPVSRFVDYTADKTGTYTVLVSDGSEYQAGSYVLRLAQTTKPFIVPDGDDGGSISPGPAYSGTVGWGDFDLWTFEAETGDGLILTLAETPPIGSEATEFRPRIRLFDPDGLEVRDKSSTDAVEILYEAAKTGAYTVMVDDLTADNPGAPGHYLLRMIQVPKPAPVSAGDEGGLLANGTVHAGVITIGDMDVWSFHVTAGQWVKVSLTETAYEADPLAEFRPRMRIYDPNGGLVATLTDPASTEITRTNFQTGTYFAVVTDANEDQQGAYELKLVRLPTDIQVADPAFVYELLPNVIRVSAIDPADPDGQVIFALTSGPEGLSIATTGLGTAELQWTPTDDQGPGIYEATITATTEYEGVDYVSSRTITICVLSLSGTVDGVRFVRQGDDSFDIVYDGKDGVRYDLQRSVDLLEWETIETFVTNFITNVAFIDIGPEGRVFYRVEEVLE